MSEFYHAFSVGFNAWFVVWPLSLLAIAFVSVLRYGIDRDTGKIGKIISDRGYVVTVILMAILLELMFIIESWAGVLQFFLNALTKSDHPFWALMFALAAVVVMFAIFLYSLLYVGYFVGKSRVKKLKRR